SIKLAETGCILCRPLFIWCGVVISICPKHVLCVPRLIFGSCFYYYFEHHVAKEPIVAGCHDGVNLKWNRTYADLFCFLTNEFCLESRTLVYLCFACRLWLLVTKNSRILSVLPCFLVCDVTNLLDCFSRSLCTL
ncbi:unnamed protein product, partial [Ixodes hexagonus]